MTRTLVIVEAGSCHDGSITKARRLIDVAKGCGADCCKFQFWSSAERMVQRRKAPEYLAIYQRYRMPQEWLPILKAHCDEVGIEFMTTCYLPEDVAIMAPFVRRFKIASFEATDLPLLEAHVPYLVGDCELLISCGMQDMRDPEERERHRLVAQRIPYDARTHFRSVHCVSSYPTPLGQANLAAIRPSGYDAEPAFDGFSDHTGDPLCLAGAFAVCAGASIVEVHFVIPETDRANPDAGPFALSPLQLKAYIANIRHAEQLLGDGVKNIQACETAMVKFKVIA